MRAVQGCPDSLLAAARRGALGPEDRAELSAHIAGCSLCRVMLEVGGDFDRALGDRPDDDLLAQRVADRAAAGVRRRRRWVVPIVLAAALVTTAAAAVVGASLSELGESETPPPREPERRVVPERSDSVEPVEPPSEPPMDTDPVEPTPEPTERRTVRRTVETPVETEQETESAPRTAAELFALANASRRERRAAEARALYRELQQRFPTSSEALVSRVTLGRMLLASDPRGALAEFDAYLAQRGHSGLREEALFGRASALMRLGRSDDERRAWRELLERYPGSIYAERARQRLAE